MSCVWVYMQKMDPRSAHKQNTVEIIICYVEALMSPVTKGQIFPVLEILIFFSNR